MRMQNITIKTLILEDDGLGGKIETYADKTFYGKLAFTRITKNITRVYDVPTQASSNMYNLYLTTHYNKFEDLVAIKKGDILEEKFGNYRVDEIGAFNNLFIITFIEMNGER